MTTVQEGQKFPPHLRLNLVSSLKFTNYKNQNAHQSAVQMGIEDLQALYNTGNGSSKKSRIVLLYPFPAIALGPYSQDPLSQLEALKKRFGGDDYGNTTSATLLIGISHQHPQFLKALQTTFNQQTY